MIFAFRITERVGNNRLKEIKLGLSTFRKKAPVKLDELTSVVDHRARAQRAYEESVRKFTRKVPYIVAIGGVT